MEPRERPPRRVDLVEPLAADLLEVAAGLQSPLGSFMERPEPLLGSNAASTTPSSSTTSEPAAPARLLGVPVPWRGCVRALLAMVRALPAVQPTVKSSSRSPHHASCKSELLLLLRRDATLTSAGSHGEPKAAAVSSSAANRMEETGTCTRWMLLLWWE